MGLAVGAQNFPATKILLRNAVKCDFEDGDRLPPHIYCRGPKPGCMLGVSDPSDPDGFIPPLVCAVLHNDTEVVKTLLDHGADAYVEYHEVD